MDSMSQITAWLTVNLQYVILALTAMILLALIVFININIRLAKLNRRYKNIMQGMDGVNLEGVLIKHLDTVRDAAAKVVLLDQECRRLDGLLQKCIQKVGVVRFNAFEDTGSDLSFAIALLDSANNGVVISSIFGRSESRTYAKPVIAGESGYFLTDEEKRALAAAKEKSTNR